MGLGERALDEVPMTLSQTQQAHWAENGNSREDELIRGKDPKRHRVSWRPRPWTSSGLRRTGKNRRQVKLEKEGRTVKAWLDQIRGRGGVRGRKLEKGAQAKALSPGFASLMDDGRWVLLGPQAQLPRTTGDHITSEISSNRFAHSAL